MAGAMPLFTASFLSASLPIDASAGGRPTKAERQISVMEKIIDEMLVDSPNFLVGGRNETSGFEMEDYGAVFMFDATLTGVWWDEDSDGDYFSFWPFNRHRSHVIVVKDGDSKDKEIILGGGSIVIRDGDVFIEDEDGDLEKLEKGDKWEKLSRKELEDRQAQKYERAKQELIDVMLEAGDILKAIPSGQMVKIVADFHDMDDHLSDDREIEKLTVQAKIDDLRAYADGDLSEEQARARITVKES
jgi:hypothetical protein